MTEYTRINQPFHNDGGSFGLYSNAGIRDGLDTYCAIKGITRKQLDVEQGCYHTGYKPSAGTHDKSDCKDLSPYDWEDKCWTLNLIGFMAEHRTTAQGFAPHVHMGRLYATSGQAWLVAAQCTAYVSHNSNGLGNLSHGRTQKSPRYRGIKHVAPPIKDTYVSVRTVNGFSQPGTSIEKDKDLKVSTHPAGWELNNICGIIRCNNVDYFVNDARTFFRKTDFAKKGATPTPVKVVAEVGLYRVTAEPFLWGLDRPGVGNTREAKAPTGSELITIGYVTVGKTKWYQAKNGFFYSGDFLTPATAPPQKVTELALRVATQNVIERRLTATGKNSDSAGPYTDVQKGKDYKDRVPLLAKKNTQVFKAKIIGTQESGTYANADTLSKAYGPTFKNVLHGDNRGDLTNAVHWDNSALHMLKEGKFVVPNTKHNDHNWATWVMLEDVTTKRDVVTSSFHADYRKDDSVLKVQATEWAKQLKVLSNGTRAIVAMADANESRDEKVDEFGMAMRAAGFIETEVACPVGNMKNLEYDSTLPSTSTTPRKGKRHIDRIWVWVPPKATLKVVEWGIAVQLTTAGKIPQPIASDHWGTFASLVITYN